MEDYINHNTLIKNEITDLFLSSSICTLCKNILIKPVMCMKCQKVYCKNCIDKWKEKNEKCPDGCDSPDYQNSLAKIEILSKFKFMCPNCGQDILYNDVEKHPNSCPGKKSSEKNRAIKVGNTPDISKLKKLDSEEINKMVKEGKEVIYMHCKSIFINKIFKYSNNFRNVKSWKNEFN